MDLRFRADKDLDELINYGFKYCDTVGQYYFNERNIGGLTYICINKWNRKVVYRQDVPGDCICLMKLYDLIKDGLIIKEDKYESNDKSTDER